MQALKGHSNKCSLAMTAVLAVSMAGFAEPAMAADIFDRFAYFTSRMGILKTFFIWLAFVFGWAFLIAGGIEMYKMSKPDQRGEATWKGVGVKFIAGAILVYLTMTNDVISETLFGGGTGGAGSPNMSMLVIAAKQLA